MQHRHGDALVDTRLASPPPPLHSTAMEGARLGGVVRCARVQCEYVRL